MQAATNMYNIEVKFQDQGTHIIGIEGSDKEDAQNALYGVLNKMGKEEYSILSVVMDGEFNVNEERLKARKKREFQDKFQKAGTEFAQFVKDKKEKYFLVVEDGEFVTKSEKDQIHGEIAAVFDPKKDTEV